MSGVPLFTNNATTTIAAAVTSTSQTSITLATGTGALFPVPSGGNYFYGTLVDNSNNIEIVQVTGISGDVVTVTRGVEGTTARTFLAGSKFELRITAATLNSFANSGGNNASGTWPISVTGTAYGPITQNLQTAGYTLQLSDSGKHIFMNTVGTYTIPANGSVAFPVGTAITFVNTGAASTIAISTDSLYLAGSGATGNRTLGQYGIATIIKMWSTAWIISGTGLT